MRLVPTACVIAAAGALLTACGGALPTYRTLSGDESVALIAGRQQALRTVSAECEITLTDAEGRELRLDAALVVQAPARVRLRAWKLGRAVFDLTLVEGRAWLFTPEEGARAGGLQTKDLPVKRVGEALSLLGPEYFRGARAVGGDDAVLIVRGSALGRDDVECRIDRRTLVPRRFTFGAGPGSGPHELALDAYRAYGPLVWPADMRLTGPSGAVALRFTNVELNGEPAPGAFTPPARASEIP